jgi:hypothetical protein
VYLQDEHPSIGCEDFRRNTTMKTQHYIAAVGVVLLLSLGLYMACGMEVGDTTDGLAPGSETSDVDAGGMPPPVDDEDQVVDEVVETAPTPAEEQMQTCGSTTCEPGESCCHMDGTCYPSDCADCCASEDEMPPPQIETPDPTVLPHDGLAGPEPGFDPPEEGPVNPPEGVDRP